MEVNKPKKTSDREYYLFALRIMGDFGASIAAPVVVFSLIGKYLDEKFGKWPLLTIVCFVFSAILTAKIIHKKAKRYGAEYERMDKK